VIKRYNIVSNLEHVKLPEGLSVKDAIEMYMSDPNVEYAEPNYIRYASDTIPNDPLFSMQWALRNTGNPGADIKATNAWDISAGSSDIIMAFLDTGIDYSHSDLMSNVWNNLSEIPDNGVDDDVNGKVDDRAGWNFVSNNNDPMDDNGHGTHVAGITGAVGNNSIGIAGLMWNIKMMPLKILDAVGGGTIANEIVAIQYAVSNGAKVINASFSGSEFSKSEFDAIATADKSGVLLIAAAGNGGIDVIGDNNDLSPVYPANYKLPNIISVAATARNDFMASFSNFGLNSVHVAAPGDDILSTYPSSLFTYLSGTSMSASFVSGLAGLLYSNYGNFNYSQIRGTILRFVDIVPALQGLIQTGGRINAYSALSSLLPPTGFYQKNQSSRQVSIAGASNELNLVWTDNATGEDAYTLERKTGEGSYILLATLGANSTMYTDNSVIDGTDYIYRLKVINSLPNPPGTETVQAESQPVESVIITPLNSPTSLQAVPISSSQVSLTWTDNSQTEDGYRIERKEGGGNFIQIAMTGPNITTFTDSGLSPSTNYTYRIRAFNSVGGDSQYSNEASLTTPSTSVVTTSGGGGGCTIGRRLHATTAGAELAVLLIPLVIVAIMKRTLRHAQDKRRQANK
jgi:subtilisin family serine protease